MQSAGGGVPQPMARRMSAPDDAAAGLLHEQENNSVLEQSHLFALALVLAWMAGFRAYMTVFGLGLAGWAGWADLPAGLELAASPWVLGAAGVLTVIEFSADKIPGVDSAWDLVQTVVRIPVGAWLAAAAAAPPEEALGIGWLAAGAATALGSHALKTGSRLLINTSPEPASNWAASTGEDAATLAGLALLFSHPWLALALLIGFSVLLFTLLLWIARRLLHSVGRTRRPSIESVD